MKRVGLGEPQRPLVRTAKFARGAFFLKGSFLSFYLPPGRQLFHHPAAGRHWFCLSPQYNGGMKRRATSTAIDLSRHVPAELRPLENSQTLIPRIAKDSRLTSAITNTVRRIPTRHELFSRAIRPSAIGWNGTA